MNWKKLAVLTVLVSTLSLGINGIAGAVIMQHQSSHWFDWKYDFEGATANTPDNLDLDGNGYPDFKIYLAGGGSPGSVSDGILTISTTGSQSSAYLVDGYPEGIWIAQGFNGTDGYTIDIRAKITPPEGTYGAFGLLAGGQDGANTVDAWMNVSAGGQSWKAAAGGGSVGTGSVDNTDGFHDFRLAFDPVTQKFSAWRDGYLLNDNLGDCYAHPAGYNRLLIGDCADWLNGTTEFGHIRFTEGAFAPQMGIKDSQDFDWKYEFEPPNEDTPDNIDLDDSGSGDFVLYGNVAGTVVPGSGVLTLSTNAVADNSSYSSEGHADALWTVQGFDVTKGFTLELSAKIIDQLAGTLGTFGVMMGPADATGASSGVPDSSLNIGANGQTWGNINLAQTTVGDGAYDNDDGEFHVFRLILDPATLLFSVWRDGELLADDLGDCYVGPGYNRMLIGDWYYKLGGTVEFDYMRFTEGAFAPVPEPSSLVLILLGLVGLACCRRRKR